ncbi:MAG TPA: hypothetical protein VF134_08885 [Candidatus Dormibacteraeota bacterium]
MVDPGLCASCQNARPVAGARSTFVMCELSRTDPRFPRYPRLPVLRCEGYRRRPQEPANSPA